MHEEVYPGSEKQKYVVRRLLRRAVLDGHQMGVRKPFLHQLVPVVAEMMKGPYPELTGTTERVSHVIKTEEANFLSTIDAGLERIERLFDSMKRADRALVSGREAAELYTTHGFPPELLETLAAEHNFTFDWDGFQLEMEEHGKKSGGGVRKELFKSRAARSRSRKCIAPTQFLGYDQLEAEAHVSASSPRSICVETVSEDRP